MSQCKLMLHAPERCESTINLKQILYLLWLTNVCCGHLNGNTSQCHQNTHILDIIDVFQYFYDNRTVHRCVVVRRNL